jgi:hypothetical protein
MELRSLRSKSQVAARWLSRVSLESVFQFSRTFYGHARHESLVGTKTTFICLATWIIRFSIRWKPQYWHCFMRWTNPRSPSAAASLTPSSLSGKVRQKKNLLDPSQFAKPDPEFLYVQSAFCTVLDKLLCYFKSTEPRTQSAGLLSHPLLQSSAIYLLSHE